MPLFLIDLKRNAHIMLPAQLLQKLPQFLAVIGEAAILREFFEEQVHAGEQALEDVLQLLGLAHLHLQHLEVVVVLAGAALAVLLRVFGVEGAPEGGF